MDRKKLISKILGRIIVPIFIITMLFLLLSAGDSNVVPRDENIFSTSLNYEVHNNEVYYLDNESYGNVPNKLLIYDTDN